jgi:cell division protein FtsB
MKAHPIFTNKLFLAIGVIALIFFAVLDARQYREHRNIAVEINSLQQQQNSLQQQNNDLQNLVNNWQGDASNNAEKVARDQFGMQKPGETVYSFENQQPSQVVQAPAGETTAQAGQSDIQKWWDYFFKND